MEDPNYKPGIKKIMSEKLGDFTIERHALALINRLLQNLNTNFANKIADIKDDTTHVTVADARSIVEAVLTGNTKCLAFLEGDRIVGLYTNGLLQYRPPETTVTGVPVKKKRKHPIATAALEFNRGVEDLSSRIFPQADMQNKTVKILCEVMEETAEKISDFVQMEAGDNITVDDVRNAIINILPDEIANHAITEGNRMIYAYDVGRVKSSNKRRKSLAIKPKLKNSKKQTIKKQPKK